MNTIRLTLNQNLEKVFSELEDKMKPLSRTEIIKTALAEMYRRVNREDKIEYLSKMEEIELKKAVNSQDSGILETKKDIKDYFNNLS